jgi:hypothetical protein
MNDEREKNYCSLALTFFPAPCTGLFDQGPFELF